MNGRVIYSFGIFNMCLCVEWVDNTYVLDVEVKRYTVFHDHEGKQLRQWKADQIGKLDLQISMLTQQLA